MQAFNRAVLLVPEIEECHMIASRFDYLLKVRTDYIQAYRRMLAGHIPALPDVAGTSTYFAMEAVKEGGKPPALSRHSLGLLTFSPPLELATAMVVTAFAASFFGFLTSLRLSLPLAMSFSCWRFVRDSGGV